MKKISANELLDNLQADVRQLLLVSDYVKRENPSKLRLQPAPQKWSVTQVLEHLNAYCRYYLPAIDGALSKTNGAGDAWFRPGWLGNYFTNMMLPKNASEVTNKMKAPKGYYFENNGDPETVLEEFIRHQNRLLELLDRSRGQNLNGIRIPISISRVVKLKLGDTFRFFIAHQQRHFVQLNNTLQAVGAPTDRFPAVLPAVPL